MTTFLPADINTTGTALTITGLSTVGAAAYSAVSSLVDNTSTAGAAQGSWGYVRLSFSTALAAGTGAPFITCYGFPALDGSTIANPPGTTSAQAPGANVPLQDTQQLTASGNFSVVDFGPFPLDGTYYGFSFYNNSGVAFSGTVTATLFRDAISG